jgi:hypothetical protein
MSVVIPDTTEMIKDGQLTPVGIQFFTSIIEAQESGAVSTTFSDEQIAILNQLGSASLSSAGQVTPHPSSYIAIDGANRATWTAAQIKVAAGTATLSDVNDYLSFIMSEIQFMYFKQVSIVERLAAVEDALWEQETLGQS